MGYSVYYGFYHNKGARTEENNVIRPRSSEDFQKISVVERNSSICDLILQRISQVITDTTSNKTQITKHIIFITNVL